jgi:hypothetical protein
MDHKDNYVQLYKGLIRASDYLDQDKKSGYIQIGVLIEALRRILKKMSNDDSCEECCEIDDGSEPESNDEMSGLKECVDLLKDLRSILDKKKSHD